MPMNQHVTPQSSKVTLTDSRLEAMLKAAQAGAEEARRWGAIARSDDTSALQVEVKALQLTDLHEGDDLVTVADRLCEAIILDKLNAYQELPCLAEESASEVSDQMTRTKKRWVVDPIDGTKPFTQGKAYYSQTLAYQEMNAKGEWETKTAVVAIPECDEYYLANSHGAWKVTNGKLSPLQRPASEHNGAFSSIKQALAHHWVEPAIWVNDKEKMADIWRPAYGENMANLGDKASAKFSTAHQICRLIDGENQGVVLLGGAAHNNPWDHDAAMFIAQQAGCHLLESKLLGEKLVSIARTPEVARAAEMMTQSTYQQQQAVAQGNTHYPF